jgi:predicted permease
LDTSLASRILISTLLIVGCLIGLRLNFSGVGISEPFVALMGNAALPMGLMAVSAGLQLKQLRGNREALGTEPLFLLLLTPLLAAIAVSFFLGGEWLAGGRIDSVFYGSHRPASYILSIQKNVRFPKCKS